MADTSTDKRLSDEYESASCCRSSYVHEWSVHLADIIKLHVRKSRRVSYAARRRPQRLHTEIINLRPRPTSKAPHRSADRHCTPTDLRLRLAFANRPASLSWIVTVIAKQLPSWPSRPRRRRSTDRRRRSSGLFSYRSARRSDVEQKSIQRARYDWHVFMCAASTPSGGQGSPRF